MDFSVVLVLPLSAVVAFAALVWAAATGRSRPRLIWPFALSTLFAATVFMGSPTTSTALLWFFSLLVVAMWAAFGTVVGALIAKLVARLLRLR